MYAPPSLQFKEKSRNLIDTNDKLFFNKRVSIDVFKLIFQNNKDISNCQKINFLIMLNLMCKIKQACTR